MTLAVWFGVTTVILHHLSLAEFGLWTLSTTLAGYVPLLDLGIGDALTRYLAASRARDEPLEENRWIASAFRIYLALGALTLVLTALFAPIFHDLFHLPRHDQGLALPVVALAGLSTALSFPALTSLAVLQGIQRFDLVNIVSMASALISGVAIVVVLWLGGNVVALTAVSVPMQVLSQIPMVMFIRRAAPELSLRWSLADRDSTRSLVSFGLAQAVVRGSRQARTYCDEIIIGAIKSVRLVTPYSVVRRITQPAGDLSDQLLDTLLPLVAHLHAREDRSQLREVIVAGTRAAVGTCLLVGVSVSLLAEPFIRHWAGARYVTHSSIAPLLLTTAVVWAILAPAENLLAGMRRLRTPVLAGITAAVVKVALAVGLGLAFGVVGVAASGGLAALINAVPVLIEGIRVSEISAFKWARQALAPPGLAAGLAAAAVLGTRALLGEGSLIIVMLDGAAGSLVFAAVYLSLPPAALERTLLVRVLGPGFRRLRSGRAPRREDPGEGRR